MDTAKAKPIRVYQLAHHFNLASNTLLDELGREGFILKRQHLSPITEQMLDAIVQVHMIDKDSDSTINDFRSTIRQWERENPAAPILSRRHDMAKESVGKKLRYWRKSKKLSQKALADMAGVSPVTINQLETKDRTPRAQTFALLLKALGITREQFFTEMERVKAEVSAAKPAAPAPKPEPTERRARRVKLDNIDLELINQILGLGFDEKIAVLKYIRSL
jgi:transcriptional regulator with XRE-family HTH domain